MSKGNKENTFWRDGKLSKRVRKYGIPTTDLDLIILEFNQASPVAIMEFKNERAERKELSHPTIVAIMRLCDAANIFFFLIRYSNDFSKYIVTAINQKAHDHLVAAYVDTAIDDSGIAKVEFRSEGDYVAFLYGLCGAAVPVGIKAMFAQKEMF